MKICILGEFSGNPDEAMRKTSFHIAEELGKRHQILALDSRNAFVMDFWKRLKAFSPDVVHQIHGPTIKGLILLKLISLHCHAKTVTSAMHWEFSFLSKRTIPMFRPTRVLVQSRETEEMFKSMGVETDFLPSGVDVSKFKPVTPKVKEGLREKYGLDRGEFIILHIGRIVGERNVQLLERLQGGDSQVLIVGGAMDMKFDKKLVRQVRRSGCLVWMKWFNSIEEIYALSDCYVFPTLPIDRLYSVEMPLSVLEAMSCNLPVVTTRFGALPDFFEEGHGLFFVENREGLLTAVQRVKSTDIAVRTRKKVMELSWENVGKRLVRIYSELHTKG